jgi:hypothetical protein
LQQYVNAYTGASAVNTHASNENFDFGAGILTNGMCVGVANGFNGNIKLQCKIQWKIISL